MDEKKVEQEVSLEQTIKDREISIGKTKDNLSFLKKELKYKTDQLTNNKIIERNQSGLYNITSFPIDDIKPKHVLEIEIGMIQKIMEAKQDQLKIMEELQIEDEKKL